MNFSTTIPALNATTLVDEDYQKRLNAYVAFRDFWNNFRIQLFIMTTCFGVISSFLTFLTFCRNKKFSDPCFSCYQGHTISELVYQIYLMIFYVFKFNERALQVDSWCWMATVLLDMAIVNLSVHYSSVVIIFLNVHRAVACLMPQKYYLMNSRPLCLTVAIGTFLLFVPMAIPQAYGSVCFLNNNTKLLANMYVNDGYKLYSTILSWFRTSLGIMIMVTSILAIVGMLKGVWLRRRLLQTKRLDQLDSTKQMLQLCFLQLSQAIPMAVTRILYLVLQIGVTTEFIYDDKKQAIFFYTYLYRGLWISYDISRIIEHNAHFYLYVLFSESFRSAFKRRFVTIWKSSTSSVGSTQ